MCARPCARARRPAGRRARPHRAKMDLAAQPVLAFTIVRSARMDDEALSWFVDNDVTPACWPCAAWARSTAWAA
jgi:hypothetical protein